MSTLPSDELTQEEETQILALLPSQREPPAKETSVQYQCRKCGSSDVMPWPTTSANGSDRLEYRRSLGLPNDGSESEPEV